MKPTLYFLHYNNYYNRIVKKENTLQDYQPYVIGFVQDVINWNPNDGVSAKEVINWSNDIPDYMIVVDENGDIDSRWFVIEATRIRALQLELTLYRDVIVDNYDTIIQSPCFIEKATVDSDNPLIYNSENMTFNQIKSGEAPLKDQSGCAWLVGYFARTSGGNTYTELKGTITTAANADYIVNGPITDFEYYQYLNKDLYMNPSYIYYYMFANIQNSSGATPTDCADFFLNGLTLETRGGREGYVLEGYTSNIFFTPSSYPGDSAIQTALKNNASAINDAVGALVGWSTAAETSEIMNLNGRVVQYQQNGQTVYSRIKLVDTGKYVQAGQSIINANQGSAYTVVKNMLNSLGCNTTASNWGTDAFRFTYKVNKYRIELEDVDSATFTYDISNNRFHPSDCPYDIFAIPYGDNITINGVDDYDGSTVTVKPSKSLMLNIASEIAAQQGSVIYDLQVLPYCPMQSIITGDNTIDVSTLNRKDASGPIQYCNIYKYNETQSDSTSVGIILLPTYSSFTFNIPISRIMSETNDIPLTITNTKVQALCDMYRLCSPNYNGQFEFNLAKNQGMSWINVDCTYLPFTPYIHLNPNFQNLYGSDYNDARGLICGGEFSITILSDSWTQYQIQNKNFQNIFDRQIQNMEIQNKYGLLGDIVGAVTGTAAGAAAGAAAGSIVPGIGTAVGAVAGGLASAGGGIADVYINQQLRNESLDYTKDLFGYQLGNIRALPDSIVRTTSITYNNKIFPILEYYTCTDVEKQALIDKMKYNGMTVMAIGKIADYLQSTQSYIKGKLIRLEGIADDFHMLRSIADEIYKGVFI